MFFIFMVSSWESRLQQQELEAWHGTETTFNRSLHCRRTLKKKKKKISQTQIFSVKHKFKFRTNFTLPKKYKSKNVGGLFNRRNDMKERATPHLAVQIQRGTGVCGLFAFAHTKTLCLSLKFIWPCHSYKFG